MNKRARQASPKPLVLNMVSQYLMILTDQWWRLLVSPTRHLCRPRHMQLLWTVHEWILFFPSATAPSFCVHTNPWSSPLVPTRPPFFTKWGRASLWGLADPILENTHFYTFPALKRNFLPGLRISMPTFCRLGVDGLQSCLSPVKLTQLWRTVRTRWLFSDEPSKTPSAQLPLTIYAL